MTITERAITITADNKTKVYGEPDPSLTWHITSGSIVTGDTINGSLTYTGINVGTYDIVEGIPFENSNYAITFIKGAMAITERAITITADNKTKVYGEPDPALTWQVTSGSIVTGDSINGSLTYAGANVGTYDIVEGAPFENSNYSITFSKGTMTITERTIIITANNKAKIYGEPDPALTWQVTSGSIVDGDTINGSLTYAGVNVGTYDIIEDVPFSNSNYIINFIKGTMTITERAITITADNKTKVYGEPDPALTWQVTSGSIVTGDTINGSLKYIGVDVGIYDIIENAPFLNSNYAITFVKGTMTITERAITITADDKTKVYGESDPTLTWHVTSGSIITGDTINGSLKYTGTNVGTYDIMQNTPFVNNNYAITFAKGTMTITERTITITADNKTKVYGESNPALTWQITTGSIVTGDTINGSLTYTGSNVGAYDIVEDVAFKNSNYIITFVNGTMAITKRAITIAADDKIKVYGDQNPALTWQVIDGSVVVGDTINGSLACNGIDVGEYDIYQDEPLENPNYHVTFINGIMSITYRDITVIANPQTKIINTPDPELTYYISMGSLAYDDRFFGTLTRTAGEQVGRYAILQGTLELNNNYILTFIGNTFMINAAPPPVDDIGLNSDQQSSFFNTNFTIISLSDIYENEIHHFDQVNYRLLRTLDHTDKDLPWREVTLSMSSSELLYDLNDGSIGNKFNDIFMTAPSFYEQSKSVVSQSPEIRYDALELPAVEVLLPVSDKEFIESPNVPDLPEHIDTFISIDQMLPNINFVQLDKLPGFKDRYDKALENMIICTAVSHRMQKS